MNKKYVFYLLCICSWFNLFGQDQDKEPTLTVGISLPGNIVKVNQDLKLKVVISNKSKAKIDTYKWLVEGDEADESANLNLEVEKKEGGAYKSYFLGTLYESPPVEDTTDNISKINLNPNDSIVHFLHIDNRYAFKKGYYRLRCKFINDIFKSSRIKSNWVYFRVLNYISIKKYYQ